MKSTAIPRGVAAATAVMVTSCWLAGVPTVILSPTVKPATAPRPRTTTVVAPALASAASTARLDAVPTFVTLTVSMP